MELQNEVHNIEKNIRRLELLKNETSTNTPQKP